MSVRYCGEPGKITLLTARWLSSAWRHTAEERAIFAFRGGAIFALAMALGRLIVFRATALEGAREGMVRLLFPLWLGLILVAQSTDAQTPQAVSTADRHHLFIEHVERRYAKYLQAEHQGDTAAYREVRTSWAYETTLDQLKKLGKAESELGPMLKRVADLRSDISQFTFVRCDAKTRVARLLYRHEGVGPKGPTLEFAAFMTHWEAGAWRIGWVGRASGPATRSNGQKLTADELLGDPRFSLD